MVKNVYLGFFDKLIFYNLHMASHTDGYFFFFLHIVSTFRVTHSTNEDLLNIKCKGDAKSRILSRTSDTTETLEPVCNKGHFVSLFYLYFFYHYFLSFPHKKVVFFSVQLDSKTTISRNEQEFD